MKALILSRSSSMLRSRWFSLVASWVSLSSCFSISLVYTIPEGCDLRVCTEPDTLRST